MASTYSDLKIELITTGEQSGTWGTTTNTNLGTALEEAITGSADVTFSSGNVTLTLTDTNAAQVGRNLRLNLTGTTGGARDLVLPAIQKLYLINNGTADIITCKNASGTTVAVPAATSTFIYNTGTNVVDATSYLSTLSLGSALAVTSGGTGATTAGAARTALGTAKSGANSDITSLTGLTTALTVAQGGTGATTLGDFLMAANDLSELNDPSTARGNLELGSMAVQGNTSVNIDGGSITGITDLAVADDGTGASNASTARTNLGLGNVENTALMSTKWL